MKDDAQAVVQAHYDDRMFSDLVSEYVGHSDFHNFGFWRPDTQHHKDASENLMEELLALIPNKTGTILDVACGKGATTRHLLKYYLASDVVGINISDKQLDAARENAPECTFHLMDAAKLDFPDESFDNMISVEAAFHFRTRERFFQEALRVLRPSGRLVLTDVLVHRVAEKLRPGRVVENYIDTLEEYEQVVLRSGFDRVTVRDCTEESWIRFYWHAIRYYHEKLLAKEITTETLKEILEPTYRRVSDITYYLHICCEKGGPRND